jgi:hypothetical protein
MSINFVVEQADSASTKPTQNTPGAITRLRFVVGTNAWGETRP